LIENATAAENARAACEKETNMRSLMTPMATVATILLLAPAHVLSQDLPNQRAVPGNEAPAGPYIFYWGPVRARRLRADPRTHGGIGCTTGAGGI
jgi:hypothetical protein